MKAFTFSFAATSLAFVLGCQGPRMNNPVAAGDESPQQTFVRVTPQPNPGQISFDQKVSLANPGLPDKIFRTKGNVLFTITTVPVVPGASDGLFDVRIDVKGEIAGVSGGADPWTFGALSKDRLAIPQGVKVILTKDYTVYGAGVPTFLKIQFSVAENGVAVGLMSLAQAADITP